MLELLLHTMDRLEK